MLIDAEVPTTMFAPFSPEAKAAATKAPMQHHPAFFHARGFTVPFDEMLAWMQCVDHPFDIRLSYPDPLEVVCFAEEMVPRDLCPQVLMDVDSPLRTDWIIYLPTRSEYMGPSVIRRDIQRPTLEPFIMREEDLPMGDWLLNTAGTFTTLWYQ